MSEVDNAATPSVPEAAAVNPIPAHGPATGVGTPFPTAPDLRPHAEVDQATPGRSRVKFAEAGKHTFPGQFMPLNYEAKEAVAEPAENDQNVWSIPAGSEAYVPDDVASGLIADGHATAL